MYTAVSQLVQWGAGWLANLPWPLPEAGPDQPSSEQASQTPPVLQASGYIKKIKTVWKVWSLPTDIHFPLSLFHKSPTLFRMEMWTVKMTRLLRLSCIYMFMWPRSNQRYKFTEWESHYFSDNKGQTWRPMPSLCLCFSLTIHVRRECSIHVGSRGRKTDNKVVEQEERGWTLNFFPSLTSTVFVSFSSFSILFSFSLRVFTLLSPLPVLLGGFFVCLFVLLPYFHILFSILPGLSCFTFKTFLFLLHFY